MAYNTRKMALLLVVIIGGTDSVPGYAAPDELVSVASDADSSDIVSVRSIRVGLHADYSRFVIDLDMPVDYAVRVNDDINTVELTLRNAVIQPTALLLGLGGTPVSALDIQQGDTLVFQLSSAARAKVYYLAPNERYGHRLVMDLHDQPAASKPVAVAAAEPVAEKPAPRRAMTIPSKPSPVRSEPRARDEADSADTTTNLQFGGTWQQELAVTQDDGAQKFEAIIQPRVDIAFANDVDLTAIARVRLDTVGDLGPDAYRPYNYSAINGPLYNTGYVGLELRELYLDIPVGSSFLRLGKQQVVWGESDGIKVLDVVNPQSFREFILDDFDDSRIPLWMANVELPVGREGALQLLWIPDTTYHELAEQGSPYALTSPLFVPSSPAGLDVLVQEPDKPDDVFGDSDIGARYRTFLSGWDISLNYLYSYADFPVPFQQLRLEGGVPLGVLAPQYKRNHLTGASVNNAFGDVSLRAELAYNSDKWFTSRDLSRQGVEKSAEVSSVIGLDWQFQSSGLLSAQWFYSQVLDYRTPMVRDETENMLSVLLQQGFLNDSWELRMLALHSLDYEDSMLQLKMKYWYSSQIEIWLGLDIFDGDSFGAFGQFDQRDRLLLGLQYGF
tara:strand:- start:11219 stop:13063 length:1845 start_codon:yes stop_codon:yes gene_type:complete